MAFPRKSVAVLIAGWLCLGRAGEGLPVQPAEAEIASVVAEAAHYHSGQSLAPFRRIEQWVCRSVSDRAERKAVEAGLLKLLEPGCSFEARRFACKQLAILGSPTALPAISGLLRGAETVSLGCLALSTYPPGEADRVLREALTRADAATRVQIINTLGDRRDLKSVKVLSGLARDSDPAVASAAISALGKLANSGACKAIRSLGSPVSAPVSAALAEATLRCAEASAASGDLAEAIAAYQPLLAKAEPLSIRRAALSALTRLEPDQGESLVLEILAGEDSALKPVAIAAVPGLRSKNASEACAAILRHLTPDEQVWLVGSLAARRDEQATLAVAVSLSSPYPPVRHAAIQAIGRIGNARSVYLLVRNLYGDKSLEERRWIEAALVALAGSGETDRAIAAAIKRASGEARASLILVLARREGAEANAAILAETGHSDPVVSRAAFRALRSLVGPADVPALLEALVKVREAEVRPDAERTTAQALLKIREPAKRSALVREAFSRELTVPGRRSLLALLPDCEDAPALAVLQAAARDPDARIRAAAINALAEWPDILAWDALLAVYKQPDSEGLRLVALRSLVRMAEEENSHPNAELVERYRVLLAGAQGTADLKMILGALGGAAHPDALRLASPLLAKPGVRAEAEFAVKQISAAIKAGHSEAAERPDQPKP